MTVRHVMKVPIDIKMMMINVNALQDIMMMALMKNATLARLKRITLVLMENVGIVIILGK